jgi:hypothetical protein
MYLILESSYRFNNAEYPECGEGYYPDTIDFEPWGVDPQSIRHFTAGKAFNI